MPTPFRQVILFGKRHRGKQIVSTLSALQALLHRLNVSVVIEADTATLLPNNTDPVVSETDLARHGDLIIVVGGDGSLLNAARVAAEQGLPVLGIHRGRLGFLTDIHPSDLEKITAILQGNYQKEQRYLLHATVRRGNQQLYQEVALNDAVLLPGDVAHMIEFSIAIDNQPVCVQRADGLIVATPTGSTAYALSGGGPILHPQLEAMVMVPMFPHKLTSRPIVVSALSEIQISIDKHNETAPRFSCDGQTHLSLDKGDTVVIAKNKKQLQLIHPLDYDYFSTLRTKLQWESKLY